MAIQTRTRINNEAYERLALSDDDRTWELWDGILREKPGMSTAHNDVANEVGYMLRSQLDRSQYRVRVDSGRLHRPRSTYFVPEVFVVPSAYVTPNLDHHGLEIYDQPLPVVVEVWSPSTGDYDIEVKLVVYQQRGDRKIWFIHPYERTLTAWRLQPDGRYAETLYREGIVRPIALPGVDIDLDALFDM